MLLHDSTIAHIAKIIQIAILTGTDIVDHLRMVTLEEGKDEKLILNEEYSQIFEEQIQKMLNNSSEKSSNILRVNLLTLKN